LIEKNCIRKSAARKVQQKNHGRKSAKKSRQKIHNRKSAAKQMRQQHGWGLFMRDMAHLV
jgi:hypothetical protein